ncbi:MAG: hypothetical protein WB681_11910 [Candidatus Cybelea sp.]
MANVVITCPTTGKTVNTSIAMSKESFATATITNNSVSCPHCAQAHTWSKQDARLED